MLFENICLNSKIPGVDHSKIKLVALQSKITSLKIKTVQCDLQCPSVYSVIVFIGGCTPVGHLTKQLH